MGSSLRRGAPAAMLTLALVSPPVQPGDESDATLTQELAVEAVRRVAPRVETLRGLAFETPVPVKVIDDAAARRYMLERLETFDQVAHLEQVQEVWRLLGLIEPDTDVLALLLDAMEEQAGGFYDPAERSFFLLDDMPAGAVGVLAAHELTHALEDQHFDLDRRLEQALGDDDRLFALSSVHEGSATLLMTVWAMEEAARGNADSAGMAALAGQGTGKLDALPDVLLRELLGPYVLGMHFLVDGDYLLLGKGFPKDRVDRAYDDGPVSSEQVLHPEKYWVEAERDLPTPVRLPAMEELLGEGWSRVGEGSLGELLLGVLVGAETPSAGMMAAGSFAPSSWTNEAAAGWDGDRWGLWERGDARVLFLSTVWDGPDDAVEFLEAIPERADLVARRRGERVALMVGDPGIKPKRLLATLLRPVEAGD